MERPFRIGRRVYLRPVEMEDIPAMCRWMTLLQQHRFVAKAWLSLRCKNEPLQRHQNGIPWA